MVKSTTLQLETSKQKKNEPLFAREVITSSKLDYIFLMVATDTKIATQDDGSYEHCDYSLDGATVTFENISINTDSGLYRGYAGCNATYKNCVINGTPAERLNVTVDGVNVY